MPGRFRLHPNERVLRFPLDDRFRELADDFLAAVDLGDELRDRIERGAIGVGDARRELGAAEQLIASTFGALSSWIEPRRESPVAKLRRVVTRPDERRARRLRA